MCVKLPQGAQQPASMGPWGAPAQNFGMGPTNMSSTVGVVRPMGQYQTPGVGPPAYMATGQIPRIPFQPMGLGAMSMPPRPGPMSMGSSSLIMATTGSGGRGTVNRKGNEPTKPPSALDLLGQEMLQTQKQQQKQKQTVTPLQEKAASEQQQQQQQVTGPSTDSLLSLGLEPSPALSPQPVGLLNLSSNSPASFASLTSPPKPTVPAALDNVFVPLDTIKPGKQEASVI